MSLWVGLHPLRIRFRKEVRINLLLGGKTHYFGVGGILPQRFPVNLLQHFFLGWPEDSSDDAMALLTTERHLKQNLMNKRSKKVAEGRGLRVNKNQ